MLQNSRRLRHLCAALQCFNLNPSQISIRNDAKYISAFRFQIRCKKDDSSVSSLFIPVPVKSTQDDINVGEELTGTLNKSDLLKVLNKFYQNKEIRQLLVENGLDTEDICTIQLDEMTCFSITMILFNNRLEGIVNKKYQS
ncbi:unnamed protein product, partial [Callosobruchus maculatus]